MAKDIHDAMDIALDEFGAEVKEKIVGTLMLDKWWNKWWSRKWLEVEELFHILVEEVEDD